MNSENTPDHTDELTAFFGEPIHCYTRAQAIADGLLVDVSKIAQEAGWKFPVAVTAALWRAIEAIPEEYSYEDVEGRLWDVVWMAAQAATRAEPGTSRFKYELILHHDNKPSEVELVADCGPGDQGEPVIVIGFREDF